MPHCGSYQPSPFRFYRKLYHHTGVPTMWFHPLHPPWQGIMCYAVWKCRVSHFLAIPKRNVMMDQWMAWSFPWIFRQCHWFLVLQGSRGCRYHLSESKKIHTLQAQKLLLRLDSPNIQTSAAESGSFSLVFIFQKGNQSMTKCNVGMAIINQPLITIFMGGINMYKP